MTRRMIGKQKAEHPQPGMLCLVLLLLFSLALMFRRADVVVNCMRQGLALCARAVVPSLFPFMVLSEILVCSGAGEWMTAPIAKPLRKLLGVSRTGCCAVVLGLLCGFPVGARCAVLGYEKGTIKKEECQRVLACSSIPSSAFLISTVGATLWQNLNFGIFLYVSAILSALFCGFLLYVSQKKRKKETEENSSLSPVKIHFDAGMLPSAVRNATVNTILICAYVVFFSTLTGTVELVLGRFAANEITHTILASFLELSGGVSAAASLSDHTLATLLTGFSVGWSGLSIHCQMLSLCDRHDLSLRPYFASKLLQALTCSAMIFLFSILQSLY